MREKSTYELEDILTNRRDHYREEAVVAMEDVLAERGHSQEDLDKLAEESKINIIEQEEAESNRPKGRSLMWGPGFIVTIIILVGFFLVIPNRGWVETAIIGAIGFGAGRMVNYYYYKSKSQKNELD